MRILALFTIFLLGVISSACAEDQSAPLKKYQWKNRVILTHPNSPQVWAEQLKMMRRQHAEIMERDLVILRLNNEMQSYSKAERSALMKKYKLTKGTHVLIGKDGGEKDRQTGELDLKKWFKLIDTMPMRKKEMNR